MPLLRAVLTTRLAFPALGLLDAQPVQLKTCEHLYGSGQRSPPPSLEL